jgi:LuxR family transcriptional regulator of csgAB operon
MTAEHRKSAANAQSLTRNLIYIVRPMTLQSNLLTSFLNRETGADCLVSEDFDGVRQLTPGNGSKEVLILWDCHGKDLQRCLLELDSTAEWLSSPGFLGLINLTPGLGIEEATLARGARGFFYGDDSLELFSKGVKAILRGELWISREIMAKCIISEKKRNAKSRENNKILTNREIEILTRIASGETNENSASVTIPSRHTFTTSSKRSMFRTAFRQHSGLPGTCKIR